MIDDFTEVSDIESDDNPNYNNEMLQQENVTYHFSIEYTEELEIMISILESIENYTIYKNYYILNFLLFTDNNKKILELNQILYRIYYVLIEIVDTKYSIYNLKFDEINLLKLIKKDEVNYCKYELISSLNYLSNVLNNLIKINNIIDKNLINKLEEIINLFWEFLFVNILEDEAYTEYKFNFLNDYYYYDNIIIDNDFIEWLKNNIHVWYSSFLYPILYDRQNNIYKNPKDYNYLVNQKIKWYQENENEYYNALELLDGNRPY
jgi:hypothetical protein